MPFLISINAHKHRHASWGLAFCSCMKWVWANKPRHGRDKMPYWSLGYCLCGAIYTGQNSWWAFMQENIVLLAFCLEVSTLIVCCDEVLWHAGHGSSREQRHLYSVAGQQQSHRNQAHPNVRPMPCCSATLQLCTVNVQASLLWWELLISTDLWIPSVL